MNYLAYVHFRFWSSEKGERLFLVSQIFDWAVTYQPLCWQKIGTVALIMIHKYSRKNLTDVNLHPFAANKIKTEDSETGDYKGKCIIA